MDVRRAWISTVLIPVGIVAAIVVGTAIASALGYESGSEELASIGIALAAGVPAVLVGLIPVGFAVFFGLRARRAGDERGLVPALVAGIVGGGFVGLNVLSYLVGSLVG
jgi:hypothetical protein